VTFEVLELKEHSEGSVTVVGEAVGEVKLRAKKVFVVHANEQRT
jgi:hypothetical protein